MKRQKRYKHDRAYNKGYHAGLAGRPKDLCPHAQGDTRQCWLGGWSEGRSDSWASMNGVSGLSNVAQHEFA
jgi:ribosome modulation factor